MTDTYARETDPKAVAADRRCFHSVWLTLMDFRPSKSFPVTVQFILYARDKVPEYLSVKQP